MGQLAKQITENSLGGFGANTKKNPKEECKIVITRSKRGVFVENESGSNEGELGAEEEKEKERERKINETDEEENEKNNKKRDTEEDERKENEEKKTKSEFVREKTEVVPNLGRETPSLWCRLKRTRSNTLLISLIFSRNWKLLSL